MRETQARIKTRKNHGCYVYLDKENVRRVRKDGTVAVYQRARWRAEVHGIGAGGSLRLRKRFRTREEAMAFLHANKN